MDSQIVVDAHREGLILGSACSEGEALRGHENAKVDAAVEGCRGDATGYLCAFIAKEQVRTPVIIKSLIDGRSPW